MAIYFPFAVILCITVARSIGNAEKNNMTLYEVVKHTFPNIDYMCSHKCSAGYRICKCDEDCRAYGDCCRDALTNLSKSDYRQYLGCVDLSESGTAYMVFRKCPGSWKDEAVRNKCHQTEHNDVIENIPVSSISKHITFRNRFCAQCHGLPINNSVLWNTKITCKTFNKFSRSISLPSLLREYFDSGECVFEYTAKSPEYERRCVLKSASYLDTCPSSSPRPWKDSCESYRGPITLYSEGKVYKSYKNIECLKCNDIQGGDFLLNSIKAQCSILAGGASSYGLFLTLDFSSMFQKSSQSDTTNNPACKEDQVFVRRQNQCVDLVCPMKSTPLNGECLKYETSSNVVNVNVMYYVNNTFEDDVLAEMIDNIFKAFDGQCGNFVNIIEKGKPEFFRGTHDDSKEQCLYIKSTVKLFSMTGELNSIKVKCVENYFHRRGHVLDVTMIQRDGTPQTECNIPNVAITDLYLPLVQFPDHHGREDDIICPSIQVHPARDNFTQNVVYRLGDIVIDTRYVNRTEKGFFTCWQVFKNYYDKVLPTRPSVETNWDKSVLSYACMSLSIVCLVITLIHYFLVPNMITNHSAILLHLVIVMLCTHSMYILGVKSYPNSVQCWWIGVILHFLFLSLFFAMALSLLQITIQLRDMKNPFAKKCLWKIIIMYILPGYILAVSIIGTTVLVNKLVYPEDIWYGSDACYITRPSVLFYSFAIPVALCLIFNIFLFISMGHLLCAVQITNDSLANTNRNYFWLAVKLSSLTGVSWVIGFIAALTGVEVLEIIFEVTSSLQGLFLSFSLLSNRLVREWYRRKVAKTEQSSTRESAEISKF